jgi:peptidoglycan biosynthesis protein MviN/MurJ (putative lipid II flippase)
MAADAAKHVVHTLIMLVLLQRHLGGLRGHGVSRVAVRSLAAAVATGGAAYLVLGWLTLTATFWGRMTAVALPALAGVATYAACVFLLDIQEAKSLRRIF